jgi:hypothetical protein
LEVTSAERRRARSLGDGPREVELRIEELVLRGFAPADRYGIAEATKRELSRLLTEQGVPPSLTERARMAQLDAGSFHLPWGSNADAIGVRVAQAMYKGMMI